MMTPTDTAQTAFYKGFLMARGNFDPTEFGVQLSRVDFADRMVDHFNYVYNDAWTVDELLLHPREAAWFCDDARRKHQYYDVPDDIILRAVLNRRKNPGG